MANLEKLQSTADAVEQYAEEHLFDEFGLMMSTVDSHTGRPFEREFVTTEKVPRRARFDPWSWLTYEDSIMTAGHYIDGLVMKYEITGDGNSLRRAEAVWSACRDVSYQSQSYGGIGCFLRPYGGFDGMEKFGEPLGSDQAGPLFCGVYRLMKHVDKEKREEMRRIMINLLKWYADQGYAYRYYKCQQHYWRPPGQHHASAFYLPALAFSARETGEKRWLDDLEFYLDRQLHDPEIINSDRGLAWNFKQGGLLVLKDILGEKFHQYFTPEILSRMNNDVRRWLKKYSEPGMICRQYPESGASDFKPAEKKDWSRRTGLGFPFQNWIHGGKTRPREEATVLTALAAIGIEGAAELATEIFSFRRKVPEDFTHYLADDYDQLPEAVHLYARMVGAIMLDWWRNYWVLRKTRG